MYIAIAVFTNQTTLPIFNDAEYYKLADIDFKEFSDLKYIRKMDILAYKYLFEAIKMLLY